MKIAVTGATGFVGRQVVETLMHKGTTVYAASRSFQKGEQDGIYRVRFPELAAESDWSTVTKAMDVVIHCAARVHVMNDDAADPLAEFRKVNRFGSVALARSAAEQGVKRFIFLSSIKVNGEQTRKNRPFDMRSTPRPCDPYGVAKLEAEQDLIALSRSTGMELVIIRPVLVYGPGVQANFQKMVNAVANNIPLPLASVNNKRSMIYVENLADLIYHAAVHPKAPDHIFLASDGEDLSTEEMISGLASALGKRSRSFRFPPSLMKSAAALFGKGAVAQRLLGSLQVDINHTKDVLEWEPPFNVSEGFRKTVAGRQPSQESQL